MISDRLAKENWKHVTDDQFIKIQLIEIGALGNDNGNESDFSPVW